MIFAIPEWAMLPVVTALLSCEVPSIPPYANRNVADVSPIWVVDGHASTFRSLPCMVLWLQPSRISYLERMGTSGIH